LLDFAAQPSQAHSHESGEQFSPADVHAVQADHRLVAQSHEVLGQAVASLDLQPHLLCRKDRLFVLFSEVLIDVCEGVLESIPIHGNYKFRILLGIISAVVSPVAPQTGLAVESFPSISVACLLDFTGPASTGFDARLSVD